MTEAITIEVDDYTFTFRNRGQLQRWWTKERENWAWIEEEVRLADFRNLANLGKTIDAQLNDESVELGQIKSSIQTYFLGSRPHVAYSGSERGNSYLNALRAAGPASAAAFILVEQSPNLRTNLAQKRPELVGDYARGAAGAICGDVIDRKELALERRNYRRAIDELQQRVRDIEARSDQDVLLRRRRILAWSRRFVRRLHNGMKGELEEFGKKRDLALVSISNTEDKYRKQMALKAPVLYWKAKSKSHTCGEIVWGIAMLLYFLIAALAIYMIAEKAADYLISIEPGVHATPVYIIVSGATLGATTLIFWLGRLVMKLFFSEHHLASEAREKAVMTQAFLSMETREGFSGEERAVILASIFRNSPDGIVKDDGPADVSVYALLARLFVK